MTLIRLPLLLSLLWLLAAASLATPSAEAEQADPPPLFVEGYAGRLSYQAGEELALHVSTTATDWDLEIARLGAEREVVLTRQGIPGGRHPVPDDASSHGCRWPVSWTMKVPAEWPSGYYEATLRVEDRGGPYIRRNRRTAEGSLLFVVRSAQPGKDTKILLQLCTNTYNAYNNWGGHSLYSYHARDKLQGHRVSFNRPSAGQFSRWERPFVAWAERNGYKLDYAVNSDLEFRPELLRHYRLVLSVGHDEYWSAAMRDHLEQFIRDGGNVAFFSGNTCCWQVRSEEEGRALTCYKQWFNIDPLYRRGDQRLLATLWSHHLIGRPENELTGVGFLFGGYHRSHGQFMEGSGAYTVHRPEHWVFAGTDLQRDDQFGGKHTIVGYECDGCEFRLRDGLPVPTGRDGTPENFVILGTSPARWHPDDSWWYERFDKERTGAAVMGVYTRGGTVFTCGSTDWSHGLQGGDPVVERITRNVLDRLGQ